MWQAGISNIPSYLYQPKTSIYIYNYIISSVSGPGPLCQTQQWVEPSRNRGPHPMNPSKDDTWVLRVFYPRYLAQFSQKQWWPSWLYKLLTYPHLQSTYSNILLVVR